MGSTTVLIRELDAETVAALDRMAAERGFAHRETYLRDLLSNIAHQGLWNDFPYTQGLRALYKNTGKAQIVQVAACAVARSVGLTKDQADAVEEARNLVDPRNGGQMSKARAKLEAAGFRVYNI